MLLLITLYSTCFQYYICQVTFLKTPRRDFMLSHLPRRDLCHSKSVILWIRFCKLSKKYIFTVNFSTGPKRTIRYWTGPSQEAILRRRHNRVTEKTQSVTGWGERKKSYLLQLTSQKIITLSFPRFSLTVYIIFCLLLFRLHD